MDTNRTNITEQVMIALRRIIRAIDLHSRTLVSQYGLTGPQLATLKELANRGPISLGDLARAVSLSQATVTGIVERLEKMGLTQRIKSSQDKRRVYASVTDKGQEMLAKAIPLLQEQFTESFVKLQDWEQTQILSSLQRVVHMMEAKNLDATPMLTSGPINPATNWPPKKNNDEKEPENVNAADMDGQPELPNDEDTYNLLSL